MLDLILRHGRVLDGSGNPWFGADIGLKDGRIAALGDLKDAAAEQEIDVRSSIVAPGFIDIHTHSDAVVFATPRQPGKILQGVTTEVIANCGTSAAPVAPEHLALLKQYAMPSFGDYAVPWTWRTLGEYLQSVENNRVIGNIAPLVGHGTVRIAAMGFSDRQPRPDELDRMKALVEEALEDGAFGLSSGLIYPPGVFSGREEMVELCKIVARRGGFYATHMRNESFRQIEAIEEALDVADRSGARLEISHHKISGKPNWGMSAQTLAMMEAARDRGVDVAFDVYPYTAGNTYLLALLPPWAQEGGVGRMLERLTDEGNRRTMKRQIREGLPDWDNLTIAADGFANIIVSSCRDQSLEGKTLASIAAAWGIDPEDAVFRILRDNDGDAMIVLFAMDEPEVARLLQHPLGMVASDSVLVSNVTGKPHPRYFGTFVRVLDKYVRQERVLTLSEAVRKMTSLPAQRLGLVDRGSIRPGAWADIVVFDPDAVRDHATYENPRGNPEGIRLVLVNGQVAVNEGNYTGALNGKVLRKSH
jgi:N-acyl-D-amino-acid deacylase